MSAAVAAISPTTDTVVATIPLDGPVTVSTTGTTAGDIYISTSGVHVNENGTVSVIDPNSDTVVDTITLVGPGWMAVSLTGTYAGDIYVNSWNGVAVIDPNG